MFLGSHVSFDSKEQLLKSVKECISYGANTFMFYTGAPQNTNRCIIDDSLTYKAYELMKEHIIELLSGALPMVDLESDFLFSELDSLGVTTILMLLSEEYGIELEARDATPKNLKNIDSIVNMVEKKLGQKHESRA